MRAYPVVLCIQDTTELDFNGQEADGLGPLNYEARRGMCLHPTYAATLGREPLGVLDAWRSGPARRGHAQIYMLSLREMPHSLESFYDKVVNLC